MKKLLFLLVIALFFAHMAAASEGPKPGTIPPLFTLQDLSGQTVSLHPYLGKGPVVVFFFTSWARSCVNESEYLNLLYGAHKEKGLTVLGVAFDRKLSSLNAFAEEKGIKYDILLDPKLSTLNAYRILVIPTTVIIDRSGKIKNIYIEFDDNVQKAIEKDVKEIMADQ